MGQRRLTPDEEEVIRRILRSGSFPGAGELERQVGATLIVGGLPAFLDLATDESVPRAECDDGPIPVRATVLGPAGQLEGEILVWVSDGYLSALEFAWVTDEPPEGIPRPDRIKVG